MPANATPGGAVATQTPICAPSHRNRARSRSSAGFVLLLVASALHACGDSSVIGPSPANSSAPGTQALEGAEIWLIAGDGQEGVVGSVLGQALVIEVRDANGVPISGAPIAWEFLSGRGVSAGRPPSSLVSASTGSDGRASVQWELGNKAGVQQVSAEIVFPASTSGPSPAPSAEGDAASAPPTDRGKKVGFFANAKPDAVSAVQISPDAPTLNVGESVTLDAAATDKWGNLIDGSRFEWSSSSPSVAVVSADGTVTANSDGETKISASTSGVSGEEMVYVGETATGPQVARVVASPDTLRFSSIGTSANISVVAEDAVGQPVTGVTFGFTSSNPSVAQVDAVGRVTSRAAGAAIITVSALCCNVTDAVAVQVSEQSTSQPAGVVFHSDWTTATGTSAEALLDLSKARPWDATKGDGNGGATVTSPAGWPDGLTNVLTISHISGNDNPGVRLDQSLPNFTYGNTRGYRGYFKNVLPDVHGITSARHPWQDAAGGSNTNWEFNVTVGEKGAFAPYFELPNSSCARCEGVQWTRWTIGGGVQGDASTLLPKDSVYRFEFLLTHHPTADSMDIEVKLYNADGSLRVDSNQWRRVSDGSPSSNVEWYSINPTNAPHIRDMQIGTNGWGGGTTTTPYVTWHWAGVAVCDGWCGRYGQK